MAKMSEKQKRFADHYIETGNAAEAARRAGYSEKTARSQGQRLLTKVDVKKYIEGRVEEIQNDQILTQQEILIMLSSIAKGEAKEYKEIVTKKAEYINNPNSEKGNQQLVYNEYSDVIALPTKNSDRNKALDMLGKRYAMWTDNKNIEVSGAVQFIDDIGEDDES